MKQSKYLKIVFFVFSLSGNGTEKNLLNMSIYFKKNNIDMHIISIKQSTDYNDEFSKELQRIPIHYLLNSSNKTFSLLQPLVFVWVFLRAFFIVSILKPDLLVGATGYLTYFLSTFLSCIFFKKNVVFVGNPQKNELQRLSILYKIASYCIQFITFNSCNKIICHSYGVAEDIKNLFFVNLNKISVIYNGVNLNTIKKNKYYKLPETIKKLLKSGVNIVNCGSLTKRKGQIHLIKVIKKIVIKLPKIKLFILGKGPEEKNLKKKIKELSLEKNVFLLGFQNNVYKYFFHSDLFISTSYDEGFGNSIIEAMACGVPVISTDCPYGPSEILSYKKPTYPKLNINKVVFEKYGVLIPPFNVKDSKNEIWQKEKLLANIIINMTKNTTLKDVYRNEGKKRAEYFSMQKMQSNYLKIFRQLH